MSKLVWIGTLATAVALSLSLPAEADHGQLSGDALQALYPGATGYGTSSRGSAYEIKFSADGTVTVKTASGFSDKGKWTVEDGNYCAQWGKIRKGKKGCWAIMHKGDDNYHMKSVDGGDDSDVKIVK